MAWAGSRAATLLLLDLNSATRTLSSGLGHIKASRLRIKEDDLTEYVRYEAKALRPLV